MFEVFFGCLFEDLLYVLRWYNYIVLFSVEKVIFFGIKKDFDSYGVGLVINGIKKDDDDDFDFFGFDFEEVIVKIR